MPSRMRRLAALAVLVATLVLVTTTVAGAQHAAAPRRSHVTAGFISAIKSQVCDLLDGVETVELPVSLANLVKGGDLEASTVILFGANKLLCGGGHVEKVFSLAHDWLLDAVVHTNFKLPGFDRFRSNLPTLVHELVGVG